MVDFTRYDFLFLTAMNRPSSCQIFSVDVHKCQKSTNTNSTRFPYRSVATLLQVAFSLPCCETSWSFQTYLDIWTNIHNSWSTIAILTLVVACRGTYYSHAQTHATPISSTSTEKQTIQSQMHWHQCGQHLFDSQTYRALTLALPYVQLKHRFVMRNAVEAGWKMAFWARNQWDHPAT